MASIVPVLVLLVLASSHAQTNDVLSYTLDEELRIGTEIANILDASGIHEKNPGKKLEISFLGDSKENEYFFIAPEGLLSTAQVIDRDEVCPNLETCVLELNFAVKPIQYFQTVKVMIYLRDKNDNPPKFSKKVHTIDVFESAAKGTVFPLPLAKDPDSPENGISDYKLESGDGAFRLVVERAPEGNILDLHLQLNVNLDREKQEFYQATLFAFDGGDPQLTGSISINVTVTDENDNPPEFTENAKYHCEILENLTSGSVIIQVHADDLDAGPNGEISYGFTEKTQSNYGDKFSIDSLNGEIRLKKALNFEEQKTYDLQVTAQDQGEDSLPVFASVTVQIKDLNDHAPEIKVNSAAGDENIAITENNDIPLFVAYITVSDKDLGRNGEFNCSMTGKHFQLEQIYPTEFKIMAYSKFDREDQSEYEVVFTCTDKGTPMQVSTEVITVKVVDDNDHEPVFSDQIYTASIEENNKIGDIVLTVDATDKDSGANGLVTYALSIDGEFFFTIDPHTGVIRAKEVLDRESHVSHHFQVLAYDNGNPKKSATADIVINVIDTDDIAPEFTKRVYSFNVTEGLPVNTRVGRVSAVDSDLPPNDRYKFSLDSQSLVNAFSINEDTGLIQTTRILDRETQQQHKLIVYVHSRQYPQNKNQAIVYVNLLDQNDNAPNFEFPSADANSIYITSFQPRGTQIYKAIAVDPDSAVNAKVTYLISEGNENHEFSINSATGAITLNMDITDDSDASYRLVIMAKDSGTPMKLSVGILHVHVNITGARMGGSAAGPNEGGTISNINALILGCVSAGCGILILLLITLIVIIRRQLRHSKETNRQQAPKHNGINGFGPKGGVASSPSHQQSEAPGHGEDVVESPIENPLKTNMAEEKVQIKSEDIMLNTFQTQIPTECTCHEEMTSDTMSPFNERDSDSGCCCADNSYADHDKQCMQLHASQTDSFHKASTPSTLHVKCYHAAGPAHTTRLAPRHATIAEWIMGTTGRYPRLDQIPEGQSIEEYSENNVSPSNGAPKSCIKKPCRRYHSVGGLSNGSCGHAHDDTVTNQKEIEPPVRSDRRYNSITEGLNSSGQKSVRFSDSHQEIENEANSNRALSSGYDVSTFPRTGSPRNVMMNRLENNRSPIIYSLDTEENQWNEGSIV